ncbi:hypothetical protein ACN27J_19795 [Solwaraspora sp. WMMB762]|uniref:hypothetical protein n=1 Tax=Solwaraspora sp. WMMB762 TaxID=3404120 RepID=UPI003B935F64
MRGTRTGTAPDLLSHALMVLVWFRKGEDTALLATGFGVSWATAYQYLTEGLTVLTAQTTDLHIVLNRAATELNLPTLADSGYENAGQGVKTPIKQLSDGSRLARDNRCYNQLLRG